MDPSLLEDTHPPHPYRYDVKLKNNYGMACSNTYWQKPVCKGCYCLEPVCLDLGKINASKLCHPVFKVMNLNTCYLVYCEY